MGGWLTNVRAALLSAWYSLPVAESASDCLPGLRAFPVNPRTDGESARSDPPAFMGEVYTLPPQR